jgi:hypothetical protein
MAAMAGGRRLRCLSPACLFLAAAVALLASMPGLATATTRRYTFNVRTPSSYHPIMRASIDLKKLLLHTEAGSSG